ARPGTERSYTDTPSRFVLTSPPVLPVQALAALSAVAILKGRRLFRRASPGRNTPLPRYYDTVLHRAPCDSADATCARNHRQRARQPRPARLLLARSEGARQ